MVYFSKTKSTNDTKYVVVTNKPSLSEIVLKGLNVGVRKQNLKFGAVFDLELINQKFNINDQILGYNFTDELIEGFDNLYKIIKK